MNRRGRCEPGSNTSVKKKSILEDGKNILKRRQEPHSGVNTKRRHIQGLSLLTPKHTLEWKQGCLSPGGLVGKESGTEGQVTGANAEEHGGRSPSNPATFLDRHLRMQKTDQDKVGNQPPRGKPHDRPSVKK